MPEIKEETNKISELSHEISQFLKNPFNPKQKIPSIIKNVNLIICSDFILPKDHEFVSKVYSFGEICSENRIFWPEISQLKDEAFDELKSRIISGIMLEKSLQRKKVETIKMQAPKFYSAEDSRSFNTKFEVRKLKEKSKRMKKKVISEIAAESNLKIERRMEGRKIVEDFEKRKFNRVLDEFQKQKKIVERENTTAEKQKKTKKKGNRKAGNKF